MHRRAWLALAFPGFLLRAQVGSPLRLTHPADRDAFRRWFAALGEWVYFLAPKDLPRDITDCSALLRFCFRETLRHHDSAWARQLGIEGFPPLPEIRQYHYPQTPEGPNLFRVRDGSYQQFANAETLMRYNTVRLGDDLGAARPSDLLFFRQLTPSQPFHSMIWIGPGVFTPSTVSYVVYHTGAQGDSSGEVRRPAVEELLHHPDPRWQPVRGNANFLGVYRWALIA